MKPNLKKRVVFILVLILFLPLISASVFINEVELDNDGGNEWVEIYNSGGEVNLSEWEIHDNIGNIYTFEENILSGGFLAIDVSGLNNGGENLTLYDNDTFIIESLLISADNSDDNKTWSRVPDGTGGFVFQDGTKGASNVVSGNITINGVGDYSSIQEAIDNASSGDVIYVAEGVYSENLIINKSITLRGSGFNSTSVLSASGDYAIEITSNDVVVEGFRIDFSGTYAIEIRESDDVIIKGNRINTSLDASLGIWICGSANGCSPSDDLLIEGNEIIVNDVSTGVYSDFSSVSHRKWIIRDNYFDSGGVNLELYDVSNVDVSGNVFEGNGNSVSFVYSSEFSNVSNLDVIGNRFLGNGDIIGVTPTFWIESDFSFVGGDTEVSGILIEDNYFEDWVNAGIKIGEPGGGGIFNDVGDIVINYNEFFSGSGHAIDNYVGEIFNAEENWWGACDGPSGFGPGSGASVSDDVDFSPWRGSCVEEKFETPVCALENEDVTLYANVTSNLCIGDVIFSVNINGSWTNYSGFEEEGFGNYSYVLNGNLFSGGENVEWTVFVDDCYNHIYKNGNENFSVHYLSSLSVSPSVDGINGWYVSEPEFSLFNLDGADVFYRWDGSGALNYTGVFGLEDIPNPPSQSAGVLELSYWGDVCGVGSEQSEIFYVDLTKPKIVELNPFGEIVGEYMPEISAYLEEVWGSNSGINESSIVVKVDNSSVNFSYSPADSLDGVVSYIPDVNLSLGIHEVYVYVEDNAGNFNSTSWEFELKPEPPFVLNVNLPDAGIYEDRRVQFNVSASKELRILEYIDNSDERARWRRLCSNCDAYGFDRERLRSFRDGVHNITFRGEDNVGRVLEESVEIFVDSRMPRVLGSEPRRGFANGEFSVSFIEENPVSFSFIGDVNVSDINISENCAYDRGRYECGINVDVGGHDGGELDYWFEVEDIVGRVDSSRKESVMVDVSLPVIDFNYTEVEDGVLFGIEIFDENFEEVYYIDNDDVRTRERSICRRLRDKKCAAEVRFRDGEHNISVHVVDEAGNGYMETIEFFVDSTSPRIRDTMPRRGFANGEFSVEFDELNPKRVVLNYGNPLNGFEIYEFNKSEECVLGRNWICEGEVNLSKYNGQEIGYWFFVEDSKGNFDESRRKDLIVDLTAPEVLNFSYVAERRRVEFVFEVNEENFEEISYLDTGERRTRERRLCLRLRDGVCERTRSFRDGVHEIIFSVYDKAGHITKFNETIVV